MKAIKLSLLIFLSVMGNQLKAQLWKVYNDSAKIFQQQRDNSKAVAFFQQAHTLLKRIPPLRALIFRLITTSETYIGQSVSMQTQSLFMQPAKK